MKQCDKCGWVNEDDTTICPSCNKEISDDAKYVCNKCGMIFSAGSNFCPDCGFKKGVKPIRVKKDVAGVGKDSDNKDLFKAGVAAATIAAVGVAKEVVTEENKEKVVAAAKATMNKATKLKDEALEKSKTIVNEENLEKAKQLGREGLNKAENLGREGLGKVKSVVNEENIEKLKKAGSDSVAKATDAAKDNVVKATQGIGDAAKGLNLKMIGIGCAAVAILAGGIFFFTNGNKDDLAAKPKSVTEQSKQNHQNDVAKDSTKNYVYISGDDVILREGPSTNTKALDAMNKGAKVEVLEKLQTGQNYPWYKIRMANGKVGYTFGQFVSETEIKATDNIKVAANGIAVPKGYKVVSFGPDYINIKCIEENSMGGPKYCYDDKSINYCANVINKCRMSKKVVGGYDGEIITIYKSGKVAVNTAIGSTTIQRFYKRPVNKPMGATVNNMIAFKLEDTNDGWIRHQNGMKVQCACGNKHEFSSGKDSLGWFVATTREGIKDTLKNRWR